MKKLTLKVEKRDVTGKKVRKEAGTRIPAVVYGAAMEAQNVWIDNVEFNRIFEQGGTNTLVALTIEGTKKAVEVLIHDFQSESISNRITHVDFFAVNMKEDVETEIPLVFEGVAPAVKTLGGTLVKTVDELTVRALPSDLPREIIVDLSSLVTFEDHITVGDLKINGKVEVLADPETVIAMVDEPRSDEELAALDSAVDADVSKIEGVADKVVEEKK